VTREKSFVTDAGTVVLVEESPTLPLVDVAFVLRVGSLADPPGKEGLARIAARMLRMGNATLRGHAVDAAIEGLGAAISIDVSHGTVRLHGSVIRRSLPALLRLFGDVLFRPALRPVDLGEVKREAVAELHSRRDDDRWLAARAFRTHLFGAHPYARSPLGTQASIERIRLADVEAFLGAHLVAKNLVVGLAGDVRAAEVEPLVAAAARPLRSRAPRRIELAAPVQRPGRRILVVDKPERTQTQLLVGRLGTSLHDRAFRPLYVANAAFGGMFTARLVRAVRTERGYSYTAQSRLGADQTTEAWSLYAHPSSAQVADCAALEIELCERLV
jgi:zinc protease